MTQLELIAGETVADAEARAESLERELLERHIAPVPDGNLVDWNEAERFLSDSEGGGPWRIEMVPYLRAPLMALSDPRTKEVTQKKSAQSGATVGMLLGWVLRSIAIDPCNILLLLPTVDEAKKFSKKKFNPAYEATPCLRGRIADAGSRQGDNTILEKSFKGGSLGIVGGASARGLRMVDARRYGADDIDSLDESVKEGSQIWLLRQRAGAQWNAQGLWISSPGNANNSPITELYDEMERRGRFHVGCPHCGHLQALRFGIPGETNYGLKWDQEVKPNGEVVHYPETAAYLCEGCAALIDEKHKYLMVQQGDYLAEDGKPVYDGKHSTYGFWYNGLVSYFPDMAWRNIVSKWIKSESDPEKRKVVVNTVLAETYSADEDAVKEGVLEARAQLYSRADGSRIEVPDGVGVLTAFADIQHDRIELLIRGFGDREVSWQVLHQRIHGDTEADEVYQHLDSWRTRVFRHESGNPMRIMAMGVDSGDGSRTEQVYRYCHPRQEEGVWATKGSSDRTMKEPLRISKPSKTKKKRGLLLVKVNTYGMKNTLFARLNKQIKVPGQPPPDGYMYYRGPESEWHNGSDGEFFKQFEREKPYRKRMPNGHVVIDWRKTGANEAIDLEVGCLVMLRVLQGIDVRFRDGLAELAREAREGAGPPKPRRRGVISKVSR